VGIFASIIRNSLFSFLASVFIKLANTLVFVLAARHLTVDDLGIYTLALTYNIIFVQVASWGLDQLLVREVARNLEEVAVYLLNFGLMRLLFTFLSYALLAILVTQMPYDVSTKNKLLLFGIAVLFDSISNICQAVFVAFQRLDYVTYAALFTSLFKLGVTYFGVQAGGGISLLAWIVVITSVVNMVFHVGIIYRFFMDQWAVWCLRWDAWPSWIRHAFPFVFVNLFYTLDYQLDIVLLSTWHPEEVVGIYGAATTVLFAFLFIPQAFREAIFPVMAQLYPNQPAQLRRVYSSAARWLLALALPLALGVSLTAGDMMTFLYQAMSLRESGAVLRIIVWSTLFLFLNVPSARLMVVAGKQKSLAKFSVWAMSLNLILNLLCIPAYSYRGAAWARLASAGLFFGLIYIHTYRHILSVNLVKLLPRPLIASLGMAAAIMAGAPLALWIRIPLAAVVYSALLWMVGFVSREERAWLRQIFIGPVVG
jgi:O-antigen/teichoic acid export membrane protein